MTGLLAEIRYATRALIRDFRITLLAGVILGISIGGSAAIFALIDAVFLRPLAGVSAAGQLVRFERVQPGLSATNFSYPDYIAFRDNNRSFSGLAAHCSWPIGLNAEITRRVRGDLVTGNYFSVLGVRPALGRLIAPADDRLTGANPVAVLGYTLWRSSFGSDPAILGNSVMLNGYSVAIIGVAAPNFAGTEIGQPTEIWVPISMQPRVAPSLSTDILTDRAAGWVDIFGRLLPGIPLVRAQADLATTTALLAKQYPITNAHRRIRLSKGLGLDPDDQQDVGRLLGLLFAAVAILLLAAAANVATLFLARSIGRKREIAVRLAMGGTPAQVIRHLAFEALLLSSFAGALGALLSPWVSRFLATFQESSLLLRGIQPGFDWLLVLFILLVVVITTVLLGLAPAAETRKLDLADSLKQTSRTSSSRHTRKQRALIVSQLALSFLLLTGTGLMIETTHALMSLNPGFNARNALLIPIDLRLQHYDESRGRQFYNALWHRIEVLPDIRSAALAQMVPPQEIGSRVSVFPPGQVPSPELLRGREFEVGLRVDANVVTPHYFRTLEISLLSGRDFSEHDNENALAVAIVNKALADRMWPHQYAVGKRLVWPSWNDPSRPPMTVVGVVNNTRQRSLSLNAPMVLYVPAAQSYSAAMMLIVRSANESPVRAQEVVQQISALDKHLPVYRIETMEQHVDESLWRQHTVLSMVCIFGVLSMIIAMVGLYGVLSQWVLHRMRDIGIRVALGATRKDVLKLVLRHGCTVALAGIAAGLIGALAVAYLGSALFDGIIYGTGPVNPGILGAVAVLLLCAAVTATTIPALRALRADPTVALRAE